MMDYKELIDRLGKCRANCEIPSDLVTCNYAITAIETLLAERDANIVHGSWNKCHIGITSKLVCSRCGHEEIYGEPSNYCPNCGARMDIKG